MNLPIQNQTVFISGSGRGLGSEIAKSFYREGARVIINYRKSRKNAEELADKFGKNAFLLKGDIRNKDEVLNMQRELNNNQISITTIIHNAINDYSFNGEKRKKIDEISWVDFQGQIETSQKGLLKITDASKSTPDSVFDYIAGITPLRKITTTKDFADAVLFFASPWARAVTGQNLIVDGGLVLN